MSRLRKCRAERNNARRGAEKLSVGQRFGDAELKGCGRLLEKFWRWRDSAH